MKTAICEYIGIYWDSDYADEPHPEYVRGHVSMEDELAAIKKYYGEVKGEFQLGEGNPASIEIRSFDAVSGHTEEYTISAAGLDFEEIEIEE